jgi:hypothetical protein
MPIKNPLGRTLSRAELKTLRNANTKAQATTGLGGLPKAHSKPKPITLRLAPEKR